MQSRFEELRYLLKDEWTNDVLGRRRPPFIAILLLSLFPNLRTIELHDTKLDFDRLSSIIQRIACATRLNRLTIEKPPEDENHGEREEDKWDPDVPHALSNLTDLEIYNDEASSQDSGDLVSWLTKWAWLPSLRSIRGKNLLSEPNRRYLLRNEVLIPAHQSEVIRFELDECIVSEQDLEYLLKTFKGLRYFKYRYGASDRADAAGRDYRLGLEPWNPRGLIELL